MKVFYIATLLVILVALPLVLLAIYFYSVVVAGIILLISIAIYVATGIYAVYEIKKC